MRINSISFARPSSYYNPTDIQPKSCSICANAGEFAPKREVNFCGKTLLPKFIKRMLIPGRIKDDAGFHCYLAHKMKMFFDFNYGIRNYTVISIGRSMASMTETLGKMRRETVCLPLSGLSNGLPHQEIKDIAVYREFLKSKGLTKEIIEANPDKHYILVDNSISGDSLRNAKKFLSREDLLGNPERLETKSAEEIFGDKYNKLSLSYLFTSQRFQDYSPVGYLNLYELKNTFEQANYRTCGMYENKWTLMRKQLFDFLVQDLIDRKYKKRTR